LQPIGRVFAILTDSSDNTRPAAAVDDGGHASDTAGKIVGQLACAEAEHMPAALLRPDADLRRD